MIDSAHKYTTEVFCSCVFLSVVTYVGESKKAEVKVKVKSTGRDNENRIETRAKGVKNTRRNERTNVSEL